MWSRAAHGGERDVGALGKERMMFEQRADLARDRRRRHRRPRRSRADCPCSRPTASAGSARRSVRSAVRSRACRGIGFASGISSQRKRGAPISTVNSPSVGAPAGDCTGRRLEIQLRLAGLGADQRSDAAHAVAAGAGLRAVVVVDADQGVAAASPRIKRHELVVRLLPGCRARLVCCDRLSAL